MVSTISGPPGSGSNSCVMLIILSLQKVYLDLLKYCAGRVYLRNRSMFIAWDRGI